MEDLSLGNLNAMASKSAHELLASKTKSDVTAAGHGKGGPAAECREAAAAGAEQDGKGPARVG